MQNFAELIHRLDQSTKTGDKLDALAWFFGHASDSDSVWVIAIFSHRRPKRQVSTKQLRTWCQEKAGIPDWLFEESYQAVGDLAETIALLLPSTTGTHNLTLTEWIDWLQNLEKDAEDVKKSKILTAWDQFTSLERFVFNKLITGGFRIGVSQNLLIQALSKFAGLSQAQVAHRLMGNWNPEKMSLQELLHSDNSEEDYSKPYPFFLAHPIEIDFLESSTVPEWIAEWKWDGIRGQLIRRGQQSFIWSRGEELVNDKFPEILDFLDQVPDGTVLDGELLAFQEGIPLPFSVLQTRITRKTLSKKVLLEAPVSFIAFDLLEWEGKDLRNEPLSRRKVLLEELVNSVNHPKLQLSETITFTSWEELAQVRENARELQTEGLMLKKKDSNYETGRKRGSWWKWKLNPMHIDGVLIYAQKGHGRRADLFTDYTFGVWDGEVLVSFAKAYSGLTDAEIREVDAYVKKNTKEKFGPVRTVTPGLVFEIAFEGIQASPRHKSGIALRFPRISRWRKDKPIDQANSLADLKALLP
jgi:DNA ligase-1